ncbi:MAG: hypothetical protein LBT00_01940 [Spirochaetaceae bacterium]|jgi:hypothetical protein|nr:hypothetical protein [Spirochaetaceae bacterium]
MATTFLAEIAGRAALKPQFTPYDGVSRQHDIYRLYTGARPQNTYWTDWGGWYDNQVSRSVEIRIVNWLFPATSMADLLVMENSCYSEDGYLYVHVPRHTWLYSESETTMAVMRIFLSGPKSAENAADMILDGQYAGARFAVPSVTVKLSDVISGITLFGTFNITLDNQDGMFDGEGSVELFNSPVKIQKAVAEYPEYEDFHKIREGLVESVKVDDKKFTVTVADKFRTLDGQVCRLVNADDFPVAQDKYDTLGKPLPVVFGTVSVPLIEIAYTETEDGDNITINAKYLAAEHISAFIGLYDENGTSLPYSLSGAVIFFQRTSSKDEKLKPEYARLAGYTANRLGEIVTWLVAKKDSLQYVPSVWDVEETDRYITASPRLNLAVTGGDIKAAVQTALKSDMAYLIQKNDGRLTLRKWGEDYAVHEIPEWRITAQPEKNFSDAEKHYFSSCVVRGKYNDFTKNYSESYVYNDTEMTAVDKYLKNKLAEYETRLADTAGIKDIAASLAARFSVIKDTVRVSVGVDTSQFNLLDKARIKIIVNGRRYSNNETWVIKEINPAQDKLVMESL